MKRSLIFVVFSLLVLVQFSLAQLPQTINYQGVLKDNSGNIVADDNYDLTFRLYDASTGGTEWWSETHVGVPVADGIFNVILGSFTTFISTDPKIKFEIPYWLEIAVGASTLSPRIQLTAVPYSITTRSVRGYMNVFPSKGSVGIGTTTPESKLHIASPDQSGIVLSDSLFGAIRASLWNSQTYGGVLNLNDAGGAIQAKIRGYDPGTGVQAYFTAGNVGIGTTTPASALHVVGTVTATDVNVGGTLTTVDIGATGIVSANSFQGDGSNLTGLTPSPWTTSAPNIYYSGGSVGIGTMSPNNRLHIHSASSTVTNLQITNSSSGSSGTDGLKIGFVGSNDANVWNNENSGLVFGTNNLEQMRILNTGFVGIGTPTPSAKLEVAGDIKADSLILPYTTRYYSIPTSAFAPSSSNTGYNRGFSFLYPTAGAAEFLAPVNLPNGAVIKELQVTVRDDSTEVNKNILAYIYYITLSTGSAAYYSPYLTSAGITGEGTMSETYSNAVNNATKAYMVTAYFQTSGSVSGLCLISARIKYMINTPLP